MAKTPKRPRDPNMLAKMIVDMSTGETPVQKPEALGAALDNEELRKQIMREMGSRGGKKGGAARAAKLSPEQRAEIASNAAKQRWKH